MYKAPPEIWAKIFSYACTDTGRTGRSISLTSRAFSQICEPIRLQSVAVFGGCNIMSFRSSLHKLPARLRRVRYLLLSRKRPTSLTVDATLEEAIRAVIHLVSDTVEVLELDMRGLQYSINAPPLCFPRLTDLASDGTYPPLDSPKFPRSADVAHYPQLRRWHITDSMHYWEIGQLFEDISNCVPALTHLRLSQVDLAAINNSLNCSANETVDKLPRCIQKIFIQPGPLLAGGWVMFTEDYVQILFLETIKMLNSSLDERFVLLKAANSRPEEEGRYTENWRSAIYGEEGCWSLHQRFYSNTSDLENLPQII